MAARRVQLCNQICRLVGIERKGGTRYSPNFKKRELEKILAHLMVCHDELAEIEEALSKHGFDSIEDLNAESADV